MFLVGFRFRLAAGRLLAVNRLPFIRRSITTSRKEKSVTISPSTTTTTTTKKKNDNESIEQSWEEIIKESSKFSPDDTYRIRYGNDDNDPVEDRFLFDLLCCGFSALIVWGAFFIHNAPDINKNDWYQREAYLELARRQAAGLPLIDRNLVPVERVQLPDDHQLADFHVVI